MKEYVSSSVDFGSGGCLVGSFVLLGTLEGKSSLGLVFLSPFQSQFLESVCDLGISLFPLSLSFGLGGHNLLSCHFHHNIYD